MSMNIKHSAYVMPVSREMMLDAGVVEPTPAERAEAERAAAQYAIRAKERAMKLHAARIRLDELTDPLTRKILSLHCENERGECEGCDFSGFEAEPPDWPCSTVEAVAEHYGIRVV